MGYYINKNSKGQNLGYGKKADLLADGATVISEPENWVENLVCVVDNGMFEAAGYVHSQQELDYFKMPDSGPQRKRTWLLYSHAKELSGYKD